jgi:hypothetical protein
MNTSQLHSAVVDAAMVAAADLLGMELVLIGVLDERDFRFERVHGELPGVVEGLRSPRTDSMCHRMLAGAPGATCDAATDPFYAEAPIRAQLDLCSYVGVPIRSADGTVLGTLCGLDRRRIEVPDAALALLGDLAAIIAGHLGDPLDDGVVIRRTPSGWTVGDGSSGDDDLVSAMTLADLIAGAPPSTARPDRSVDSEDETDALRVAVRQLEHALSARVTIEQAIGALSERHALPTRAAFEMLRKVARRRGDKVRDLAALVVLSSCDPSVALPPELARPQQPPA